MVRLLHQVPKENNSQQHFPCSPVLVDTSVIFSKVCTVGGGFPFHINYSSTSVYTDRNGSNLRPHFQVIKCFIFIDPRLQDTSISYSSVRKLMERLI